MSEIVRAFDADNYLGESPIWAPHDATLWWVNCDNAPELHRWSPQTGAHTKWPMPKRIGGFVHKTDGNLLVALADGLYDFDVARADLTLRAASPLPAHVKLHECHCDRQGRFWIGAYDHHFPADRNAGGARYFRLDGAALTPVIDNIAVANGLAFSPDGKTMYVSASPRRQIEAFDLDPATGALGNKRVFLTLEDGVGHIDGATVDSEGGYWLALVGGGALRRYRADGALDREIALPFSGPTKPAFGGPDMATLYLTSTKMLSAPGSAEAQINGGVFQLRPGVAGIAETPFRA